MRFFISSLLLMITRQMIASYLLTFLVFLWIDLVWLGVVAKNIYGTYLKDFLAPNPNWQAAIWFYAMFIIWIMIFAIYPAVAKDSTSYALIYGALFGFFTYATYDLTNLATLKNWPIEIVFIDIAWGTVLCASVAIAWFYIVRFIG